MRKPYPTDLSDAEWHYIEPHMPTPKGHGRPRTHDLREILNANLLRPKERLPMAPASPRLPSVAHRLPLFFQNLADRRHLGEDQPGYPRTATGSLGQRSSAQCGRSGFPIG